MFAMQTSSGLLSTLEDTQASLATALARIEAYRLREKFLLRDNYKLREELKKTDGQTLEAALTATTSRRFANGSSSETAKEEAAVRQFTSGEGINYRLHEEYPIILHTKKGKVGQPTLLEGKRRLFRFRHRCRQIQSVWKCLNARRELEQRSLWG